MGQNSFATALNDGGQVAGGSCVFAGFFQPVTHGFFWRDGFMSDIGTLGLGDDRSPDQSVANGMNSVGQVVGRNFFGETGGIAFLWSDGTITSLASVLGGFSSALAINNAGQIVGLRGSPPDFSSWNAFVYDTGTGEVTSLSGLGGIFRSEARAINDAGVVAGYATTAGNAFHAVRWSEQIPTDLGTLGGTHSFATGINALGDVVGRSFMPGDTAEHAFLYSDGVMRDLGTLGGAFSQAFGISDSGVVVGSAGTASAGAHAFVYSDGVMRDLNDLIPPDSGWVLIEASAINASGQIAGTGRIRDEIRAFLLTP